jgi:hypothetical protein
MPFLVFTTRERRPLFTRMKKSAAPRVVRSMMSRIALATFAVLVTGLMAALPAAPAKAPKLRGGAFFSNCLFSHTAPDDPIVSSGRPGASHPHTFFGNTSTNAHSTVASLQRAETTCRTAGDTAAYWVPTLYQDGREIRPAKAQLYYVMRSATEVRAFPPGFKMIGGDANATRPQSARVAYWSCGGHAIHSAPSATAPARCPVLKGEALMRRKGAKVFSKITIRAKSLLEVHVNFPDCWDGKRIDSADHRSHVAHSREYVCPASHPVKLPLIRLQIRYPLRSGKGVTLASGGQLTAHADFFNAWDQRRLEQLVDDCWHERPCNEPG